ncbi:PEP-CTERM sorting domain-containing protein [Kamptonema cortianum]|nr:PEP-CTERM sorting domain-containing protein [Kamptonema cortianum]
MANLTTYAQNFESMSMGSSSALSDDGWLVFGNVFDPGFNYLYGYGPFGAPNGGAGFSAVATGEAGANQGTQYLNAYNDYNNGDHANGNWIEANVFQEQTIGAGDVGQIWNFTFDYKASSTAGPGGSTTTFAFIKVLDPNNGWALVGFETFETTNASTTSWTEGQLLDVSIASGWAGNILQFGFMSTATNYEPSGVFYDNISFEAVPEPGTLALLGGGLLAAALRRRKK